jgi:hypothetical protein
MLPFFYLSLAGLRRIGGFHADAHFDPVLCERF